MLVAQVLEFIYINFKVYKNKTLLLINEFFDEVKPGLSFLQ